MSEAAVIGRKEKNIEKERQFDVSSLGKMTLLLLLCVQLVTVYVIISIGFQKKNKKKTPKAFKVSTARGEEQNGNKSGVSTADPFISGSRQKCR